jgi:alpha-L-fucosidase
LQWGKEVTFGTKDWAYLAGSVQDFEKQQRAPKWIYPYPWQSDDAIGSTWGYTESPQPMGIRTPASIVSELIEHASTGGNLMLNVSPMGDGSIPQNQQTVLAAIGEWMKANGEGIYDSHAWRIPGEGPGTPAEIPPDWKGGSTADQSTAIKDGPTPRVQTTEASFRFTTAGGKLYAFGYKYPAANSPSSPTSSTSSGMQSMEYVDGPMARIISLSNNAAKVERVTLLGPEPRSFPFHQDANALVVWLPLVAIPPNMPYTLRIEGSQGLGIS